MGRIGDKKKMKKNKKKKNLKELPSIIFITCNGTDWDITKKSMESILKNTTIPYEFVHVDNGSEAWEIEKIQKTAQQIVKSENCKHGTYYQFPYNLGFTIAVNAGMHIAKGKYFIIFTNDMIVPKGWLKALVKMVESDPKIGIVGPFNAKKPSYLMHTETHELEKGFMVSLICTLVKRKLRDEIGELDPRYNMGTYEDDDYCLRARLADWKLAVIKKKFKHIHSTTWKRIWTKEQRACQTHKNRDIFNAKWKHLDFVRI